MPHTDAPPAFGQGDLLSGNPRYKKVNCSPTLFRSERCGRTCPTYKSGASVAHHSGPDAEAQRHELEGGVHRRPPATAGCYPGQRPLLRVRDLNRGAFGFVVLAVDTHTGEQVALKFIERGPENISKYVEREIINHMKLRHPHIIALREVFLTPAHLVLAMEFAPGGDLFRFVAARRGLCEDEARWFFQQLLIAVDYCHRMSVTSRDIKLENTLLDGSEKPLIKLADFGFSKDANAHSAPTSRVGTPAYLAPEVVGNQPGQTYDGQKADIWSCGVLLYIMTTDSYPFRRSGDEHLKPNQRLNSMLQRILRADYTFPTQKQLSASLRDLISRMLVVDPNLRCSLQDILTHHWFTQGLNPQALQFNNSIVEESLANQPPPEVLEEVRQIVKQAAVEHNPTDFESGWPDGAGADAGMGTGAGTGTGDGSSLDDLVKTAAGGGDDSWGWSNGD